jgi:hypothetical protein
MSNPILLVPAILTKLLASLGIEDIVCRKEKDVAILLYPRDELTHLSYLSRKYLTNTTNREDEPDPHRLDNACIPSS